MTEALSERHRRFVDEYLKDGNGSAAAKRAGFSARSAGALLARPDIRAAIERHQEKASAQAQVTLETLISECESARQIAENAGNASAMVSATQLKARLTGRLTDDLDALMARDRAEREAQRDGAYKSAGQLLADAAESLGLPRTATPAQIIGAQAERAIATPEMFALLRAQQEKADA